MDNIHEKVMNYYGATLESNKDLATNACCTVDAMPQYINDILGQIADEVKNKYYGCGLTIPTGLENLKILDLGSGSGRDCFIASKLVGETGSVVGIDMTSEQLDVANKYIDFHAKQFGYKVSNVKFVKGKMEELDKLNLEKESFDVIISNCVLNLCADKQKVLNDAYSLLKPGGEMYFSDVYSDRRIPIELQNNEVLWGECLSGALYWGDFLDKAKMAGFTDPRSVTSTRISIENKECKEMVGDIQFFSVTYRLWKIDNLESQCEDYGQAVRYLGGIPNQERAFELDDHHVFEKGKIKTVCGNTYRMLNETRFKGYFEFFGTWDTHFGVFEGCGTAMPFEENSDGVQNASCC